MQRKLVKPSESPVLRDSPKPRSATADACAEPMFCLERMREESEVVIRLRGGSTITGRMLWYDRTSVCVRQRNGTEILLFKHAISSYQVPGTG